MMAVGEQLLVYGPDGMHGSAERAPGETRRYIVQMADGGRFLVPDELLYPREDGGFNLLVSRGELETFRTTLSGDERVVIPLAREELHVGRRRTESGKVTVRTVVRERREVVDEPIIRQRVEIERVPVGELVDSPPPIREEGDTLIIPVVEEVVVLQRRLRVREEVRIVRCLEEVREPREFTLRYEDVEVDRRPS